VICIEDYILRPIKLNKKKKLDWFSLWIEKSDYIVEYYEKINGKYRIIDESIDYYVAMLEMAIYFLKDYSNYYDFAYIQHGLIIDNYMYIKEDIRERDFSEYLKYLFYKKCSIEYVYDLLEKNKNKYNYYLVGVRLIFPSYYFFYLERVILDNEDYNVLVEIINSSYKYEEYLKKVIEKINTYLIKKIVLPF